MRNFLNGLYAFALVFSSHLAAASSAPSLSGTEIPSAAQIVDSSLNTWTLSGGDAYENGEMTPSSEVILILCYGGSVFQENIHHNWWVWDLNTSAWAASSDPRITSPGGTTIPTATQIVDSALNVWTVHGGQAYEKGQPTSSSDVILLLYAKGYVYQENIHHDWWQWRTGAWVATSAPPTASASGTTIPTANEIVDSGTDVWTVSGGQVYENHASTPSSEVILLLCYGGNIYQENVHHNWWEWNGTAWISIASDPRVGQPLAYVATGTWGKWSVTAINTGTNRVTATIPIGFEARYMAVSPDAKHVYVTGATISTYGSVAVIDTAQESVVTTIRVPYEPQGVVASPDGTRVYVFTPSSSPNVYSSPPSTISSIDTASDVVTTITRPEFVRGISISPDGKTLYVSADAPCGCAPDGQHSVIDVIDTATNTSVGQFVIPSPPDSSQAIYNVLISPDNAKLYSNHAYNDPSYVDSYVDEVAVLNPTTGAEITTLPAVLTIGVFSPNSQYLYGVGLGGVGVINTTTDVSTTAVANLPGASDLAITPDGKHLYITDVSTGSVLVADTATYTISTVLALPVAASGAIAIVSAP